MKLMKNKPLILDGCVSERILESRVALSSHDEARRALDSIRGESSGWGNL